MEDKARHVAERRRSGDVELGARAGVGIRERLAQRGSELAAGPR
jgi:hypothetical protein